MAVLAAAAFLLMSMPCLLLAQEDAEPSQEAFESPYERSLRLLAEDRIEEGW